MPQLISRADVLRGINNLFEETFGRSTVEYVKKYSYGKYTIYKYTYLRQPKEFSPRTSTTLAKGLTKEEADGFLKLLKEQE